MKILSVVLVFLVFLGFVEENSYAQRIAPREHPSLPLVSLQLQLRNSDGQLVAYIEPTVMYIRNIAMVHEYLDTVDNKTPITINGKDYELIQIQNTYHFQTSGQIATYGMVYKGEHVLLFRHDGYITQPGDTLTVSWKIIRTPLSFS